MTPRTIANTAPRGRPAPLRRDREMAVAPSHSATAPNRNDMPST
jgi:hypothetical protein